MTNFKKLEKTLAVLLCASMLSSGAPKTKGMSNFRHLVSEFTKERSISILDWVGGSLIAEYLTRLLDYIFGCAKKRLKYLKCLNCSNCCSKKYKKREDSEEIKRLKKIYNRTCYLLNKIYNLIKKTLKQMILRQN